MIDGSDSEKRLTPVLEIQKRRSVISSLSSESNVGRSRGINLPMNTKCSVNWTANRQTVALYDARVLTLIY